MQWNIQKILFILAGVSLVAFLFVIGLGLVTVLMVMVLVMWVWMRIRQWFGIGAETSAKSTEVHIVEADYEIVEEPPQQLPKDQ